MLPASHSLYLIPWVCISDNKAVPLYAIKETIVFYPIGGQIKPDKMTW